MANLDRAYLAVIQRFRDYYANHQDLEIALRPISSIDTPIIEAITTETWSNQNDKYENEFLVSARANEVIKIPFTYTSTEEDFSTIYESVLELSETTAELANRYSNAKAVLDTSKVFANGLGTYVKTSLDTPTWKEEVLEASEFDGLIRKAEADTAFITAFNASFGTSNDTIEVTKVVFKKAEVNIQRPWLDRQYINSRDWRLKTDRTINGKAYLSNSNTDYSGALPGYPTKFILVKDIEIHFHTNDASNGKETRIENGHILNFGNLLLNGGRKINRNTYKVSGLVANQSSIKAVKHTATINTSNIGLSNFYTKQQPFYWSKLIQQIQLVQVTQPIVEIGRPIVQVQGPILTTTVLTNPFIRIHTMVNFQLKNKRNVAISNAEIIIRKVGAKDHNDYQKVKTDRRGQINVRLLKNKNYDLAITKKGYEPLIQKLSTTDKSSSVSAFVLKAKASNSRAIKERETNIQVLGIVYKKLSKTPNPIPNFEPIEDTF